MYVHIVDPMLVVCVTRRCGVHDMFPCRNSVQEVLRTQTFAASGWLCSLKVVLMATRLALFRILCHACLSAVFSVVGGNGVVGTSCLPNDGIGSVCLAGVSLTICFVLKPGGAFVFSLLVRESAVLLLLGIERDTW